MSNEATSGQEAGGRTDIEITVCANGVVNVHRPESDRAHSVFVDDGDVVRCSCKGHKFHGRCAHQDVIESRPLILASATAAAISNSPAVATDGGETVETCAQCGREDVEEYVCEACADANDERRDDDVSGSERADFGGGEASGMDDLGDPTAADETDDLPEIEDVGDHRCRCTGCERTGVKNLDREPVILHEQDCPHADDQEAEDGRCDECGRQTELPDDHDERELHTAGCPNLGSTVDPYADEHEEVDETPL